MAQTDRNGLDRIDRRILATLGDEGRISWRELSERVGLSLTPTLRRVKRLEDEGFITGYAAHFDEQRLGAAFSVFVSVTLDRQAEDNLEAFERRISAAPEVMSCFLMSGGSDYLLRVVAHDLPSFQTFMVEFLTRIPGVARIQSSFALKAVARRSVPPLD
jgi:Lrp/AsnC family leucine-responsive transcriptional regulator